MEKVQKVIKERESNFELLRIVGMILIILHHYAWHGDIIYSNNTGINKYIAQSMALAGKIGVNLFILISGYFLVNSKFKTKKILKLVFQVFCYSTFAIILKTIVSKQIKESELLESIFPLLTKLYWFFNIYLGMYLLTPFINKFILNIKKEKFGVLIIILMIMLCILPSILKKSHFMGNLQWFIFMYMIGAYIKLYNISFLDKKYSLITIISFVIILFSILILWNEITELSFSYIAFIKEMNFILIFGISISIFTYFKELNIKPNKIINFLAKGSFGVYLFHDNDYTRDLIWKTFLKTPDFYNSKPLILIAHIVVCVTLIYVVGCLVEHLRVKLLEEPIFKIKVLDKFADKVDKIMDVE